MKKLIFATQNDGKLNQVRELLNLNGIEGVEITSAKEVGFNEDVEETGKTFEENAYIKAKALYDYCEKNKINEHIIFADDSGLCVDKLDGAPGLYSARFAGEEATDEEKRQKILDLMQQYQDNNDRSASFVTEMVAILPNKETISSKGVCEGMVAKEIGKNPSKLTYNQLFIPNGFDRTISDLTEEEFKRVHHHREEALLGLIRQL